MTALNKNKKRKFSLKILLMLAWRNLWRNRKRTLVTLSSIAIGFGFGVFFIGINDGGHNSMIRNAIHLGEGHLTLQPKSYLEAPANHKFIEQGEALVETLSALKIRGQMEERISLQVLAMSANNSIGAVLEGVSSSEDARLEKVAQSIREGSADIFAEERAVLIGEDLANKLKLKIGSRMVLMAGKQGGDSQAQLARIKGIYKTGLDEIDGWLIISNLAFTQAFLEGEGANLEHYPFTRVAIFLDDEDEMSLWKHRIERALNNTDFDNIAVLDWREMMPQLVQFILFDDAGGYIFMMIILIMIAMGVVNTVLMSVLERTREFGLLRALGISRSYLLILVFLETFLLSLMAVGSGWLVGGSVHWWFSNNGLDLSFLMGESTAIAGTYMDTMIYTELSEARVKQLTGIIFAVTLSTGLYPAIKAARVTPVQALKT